MTFYKTAIFAILGFVSVFGLGIFNLYNIASIICTVGYVICLVISAWFIFEDIKHKEIPFAIIVFIFLAIDTGMYCLLLTTIGAFTK